PVVVAPQPFRHPAAKSVVDWYGLTLLRPAHPPPGDRRMRCVLPPRARLSAVLMAVLFGVPAAARAEWLSKWGHPVISLGWTPYDAVDTGHGYYPGSHGFIPGYGYYPGIFPNHYPWIDGP